MTNVSWSVQTLISEPYPEDASQVGFCQQERHAQSNLAKGQTPLHEDSLQLWLHALGLVSSHRVALEFSFRYMTDQGGEVGGVHSDFKRHLLISLEEPY